MKTRREFLQEIGIASTTLVIIACDGDDEDSGNEVNEDWERQAEALEANGIFSFTEQGPWEGKAGLHVAEVTMNEDGSVTLFTEHETTEEHYITAHYIRDQDNIIIGYQSYAPGETPSVTFTVPNGTTRVTAYQHCNKHDAWIFEP